MLSSVLRSKRAVLVNIEIMRAFVKLRQLLASHSELARKLDQLEKKYDQQFKIVFDAIREYHRLDTSLHSAVKFTQLHIHLFRVTNSTVSTTIEPI
jgi:hypothetical protein